MILTEVDRLDGIIERLLNFSRPIRLNLTESDLSTLSAVACIHWKARNDAIAFVCKGERDIVAITDPARLQQVLDNVIENAVQQLIETKTLAGSRSMRYKLPCSRFSPHARKARA